MLQAGITEIISSCQLPKYFWYKEYYDKKSKHKSNICFGNFDINFQLRSKTTV